LTAMSLPTLIRRPTKTDAFNNWGIWGDSIILCDLVEDGFMDADGHVIPEDADGGMNKTDRVELYKSALYYP